MDPGLTGAVATLPNLYGSAFVSDMPTIDYGNGFVKRAFDAKTLAESLRGVKGHAYVERVGPMPGQGTATMFSLGMTYWGIVSTLAALGIPVTLVSPQRWKSYFGLSSDKKDALTLARKLYPGVDLNLMKHHNRAEALLIATYGKEIQSGKTGSV